MWLWLAICSAALLGCYDVVKKKALSRNGVMWVIFSISVLSTLMLIPFFSRGSAHDYAMLVPKAALVTVSWVSGLIGMKLLPITTVSGIKASRPVFVVLFCLILFGERLNLWQWAGVVVAMTALVMMSFSGRKEGIHFTRNKGIAWMAVCVLAGAGSALYDKYAIARLDPIFILCWANLLISIMLGIILLAKELKERPERRERFRWDWNLLIAAALIVVADALYFISIKQDGALLSVVALLRRGSVIVTFTLGALVFREGNLRSKVIDLAVMLLGMSLLVAGSA